MKALLQGSPLEAVGRLLDLAWQLRRQTPHPPAKRTGESVKTWELGAVLWGSVFWIKWKVHESTKMVEVWQGIF